MANQIEGALIRHLQRTYEADAKHIVATSADEFVTNKLPTLREVAGRHAADAFDRAWAGGIMTIGTNVSNHDAFLNLMLDALAAKAEKLAEDLDRDGTASAVLAEQFTQAVACTGDIACEWIELTKEVFRRKYPNVPNPQRTTTSDQIKKRAQEAVYGALERYLDRVAWVRESSSSKQGGAPLSAHGAIAPSPAKPPPIVDTPPSPRPEGTEARDAWVHAQYLQMRDAALNLGVDKYTYPMAVKVLKKEFPGLEEASILRILKRKGKPPKRKGKPPKRKG